MGYISQAYHFTPGLKHHLRVRETYLAKLRLTPALQVQKLNTYLFTRELADFVNSPTLSMPTR